MATRTLVQGSHLPELGSARIVVVIGAAADKAIAPLSVCGVVRRRVVDNDPRRNRHVDRRVVQSIICNILQMAQVSCSLEMLRPQH